MELNKAGLAVVFEEWARRYAANPDAFAPLLGKDGLPLASYGEDCADHFCSLAVELGVDIANHGELVNRFALVRTALVSLVGSDDMQELAEMRAVLGSLPADECDIKATRQAVSALIDTAA